MREEYIKTIREAIMFARTGEHGVPNEHERFVLCDLLLALPRRVKFYYSIDEKDHLCISDFHRLCRYNLRRDSVTDQETPTLKLLAELLGDYKRAVTNQ